MNFAVVNLGCKVNRVESDAAAAQLLAAGARMTDAAEADVVVVNTCTVTGEAEKKTRKAVRRALRANAHSRLVVTGCAAAIDAAGYEAMDGRVQVVPKAQLADALCEVAAALSSECDAAAARHEGSGIGAGKPVSGRGVAVDSRGCPPDAAGRPAGCAPSPDGISLPTALRTGTGFPTRVGVKVQDGCNNACTYCIVHVARGRATSRSASEIVTECTAYARAGVREIVLTGINLGSYCDVALPSSILPAAAGIPPSKKAIDSDSAPGFPSFTAPFSGSTPGNSDDGDAVELASRPLRLSGLLRLLLRETAELRGEGEPPCRFRISSIEPHDVDDDLVRLLGQARGRICRHLHLPLQIC